RPRGRRAAGPPAPGAPRRVAPLRRERSARGRRRPALRAGDARPRRQRDDAGVHPPADRRAQADVPAIPPESMTVAKRAHAYPQVSLVAVDLVNTAVTQAPAPIAIGAALRLARKRDAAIVVVDGRCALREDLVW